MGVSVGATIGLGLAAWFGLNECEAGLPAQPAMARIRANPASARPIELRALATLDWLPRYVSLCHPDPAG